MFEGSPVPWVDGQVYEFRPRDDNDGGKREQRGGWNPAVRGGGNPPTVSPLFGDDGGLRSIRVATFNIWFDEHKWTRRTEALVELLAVDERIDVICLQEVTPRALGEILEHDAIRLRYYTSDVPPYYRTLGSYGVAMLVRKTLPVPDLEWLCLPSGMGRSLLIASFGRDASSSPVAIATVHLESLSSRRIRSRQLRIIRDHLLRKHPAGAVLVGDLNISATGPYGDPGEHLDLYVIMEGYDDLWIAERGTDGDDESSYGFLSGVTFSSVVNPMVKKRRRGYRRRPPESSRLDRVLVRTTDPGRWEARGIRIIGNRPIGPHLCISDHFGLAFEVSRVVDDDDDEAASAAL